MSEEGGLRNLDRLCWTPALSIKNRKNEKCDQGVQCLILQKI